MLTSEKYSGGQEINRGGKNKNRGGGNAPYAPPLATRLPYCHPCFELRAILTDFEITSL